MNDGSALGLSRHRSADDLSGIGDHGAVDHGASSNEGVDVVHVDLIRQEPSEQISDGAALDLIRGDSDLLVVDLQDYRGRSITSVVGGLAVPKTRK